MRIVKILISAYLNTKNLSESIIGTNQDIKHKLNSKSILKCLSDIFIPTLPLHCPNWMPLIIKKIFFGENSKYLPDDKEIEDGTCIIYVNGIMSDTDIVEDDRKLLKGLFNKPVNLLHNVTDSLIMDLLESLVGKETDSLTEVSVVTLVAFTRKLLDEKVKKLIVICYSQGTIVVAKVLDKLAKLGFNKNSFIEKLEVYAFANCSTKMKYVKDNFPYIENFANENDFVAKLGCNCNLKELVDIDGETFVAKNKSGHILNLHYLDNFKIDFPKSKLCNYFK